MQRQIVCLDWTEPTHHSSNTSISQVLKKNHIISRCQTVGKATQMRRFSGNNEIYDKQYLTSDVNIQHHTLSDRINGDKRLKKMQNTSTISSIVITMKMMMMMKIMMTTMMMVMTMKMMMTMMMMTTMMKIMMTIDDLRIAISQLKTTLFGTQTLQNNANGPT